MVFMKYLLLMVGMHRVYKNLMLINFDDFQPAVVKNNRD